jgi:pantothenate kinase-related protein Tda10
VIAASSRLRRIAASVSAGDVVRLEGWLVDADGIDDPTFRVRTSTARTDEGPGACEVVFVGRLTVNRSAYE